MAANERSYLNAIYYRPNEPLVIGLTGYTGVGSSTTREILISPSKPSPPGYALVSQSGESATPMDERVYDKLKRVWARTTWQPFTSIEVSKIIFAFFLHALDEGSIDEENDYDRTVKVRLQERKSNEPGALAGLRFFSADTDIADVNDATSMIRAYETAKDTYKGFKNSYALRELGDFIDKLQRHGDEIRRFGRVVARKAPAIEAGNVFVLPRAIHRLLRAFVLAERGQRFVIDTFKNPFEIEYFRRHCNSFFLIGLLRDPDNRKTSLLEKLDAASVEAIEKREKGKLFDNDAERLTSQDIDECIRRSDMFIYNQESKPRLFEHLKFGVIKLVTLTQSPGCVTPTLDERCMQLAMTVRLASGCISRQVGAVVVDKARRVCGLGWNDVPKGQVPCALRTCGELTNAAVRRAFSDTESSQRFRDHIGRLAQVDEPYCFRSEWSSLNEVPKEAQYTRALHAEENALLQAIGQAGSSLHGATLYTTDRTCTLCAKKAYQLGLDRIVYIDEYYDIAIEQTIKAGDRVIVIERFSGVIGAAYHRLYTAPMPEKEIIALRYSS